MRTQLDAGLAQLGDLLAQQGLALAGAQVQPEAQPGQSHNAAPYEGKAHQGRVQVAACLRWPGQLKTPMRPAQRARTAQRLCVDNRCCARPMAENHFCFRCLFRAELWTNFAMICHLGSK